MDHPDPSLRKKAGIYYTPEQVARGHVRLVQDVLVRELGLARGFLDERVALVDPALGTGNYLLAVAQAAGGGAGERLARRMVGLELRPDALERARERLAEALDGAAPDLHQVNTLTLAQAPGPEDAAAVPVIIGNPPFGRHGQATEENREATGARVRWGGEGGTHATLADFVEPARAAGQGRHLKNLYNQYVYFIRWALSVALERTATGEGPGLVSFITAASYLTGAAFCGLRQHLRRVCDEVLVLDLGGEGRGTRREENVFDIQTPVAIFLAWRRGAMDRARPARVRYARIRGTRAEKLRRLDALRGLDDLTWQEAPEGWQAPLRPGPSGAFASWPTLAELMPWRCSGIKAGRTWVVAPDEAILRRRLATLLDADEAAARAAFKDSPTGRKYGDTPRQLPPSGERLQPLARERDASRPILCPVGHRFLDRQLVVADARFLDRPAPPLWQAHGPRQLYLSTLSTTPLDPGPALAATANIPDLHHFRGSYGARDQFPLFRDREGNEPNFAPGLLERLGTAHGDAPTPEEMAGYLYGVLAHPAYQERHASALGGRKVRVPVTLDGVLFVRASFLGRMLLWLHTFGDRLGEEFGALPAGAARCIEEPGGLGEASPDQFSHDGAAQEILVGDAGRFGPVSQEVWDFSVSGLQVVKAWLGQRMRRRRGRRSSPLDEIGPEAWTAAFTDELLKVLAVLEATLDVYPDLASLLDEIEAGPLLSRGDPLVR